MHIVAIAWIFVVALMAAAEATSPQGSWLGAAITFVLYGLLPLSIVLYLMATPMRRRARRRAQSAHDGDRRGHTSGGAGEAVAPEREEP